MVQEVAGSNPVFHPVKTLEFIRGFFCAPKRKSDLQKAAHQFIQWENEADCFALARNSKAKKSPLQKNEAGSAKILRLLVLSQSHAE